MGKRGPPKKPTAIKKLEGNPGKRALPDEPEPRVGAGDPPDWMPEAGKAHWQEYAGMLEEIGVLTEADRPAWIQLCSLWAEWRQAYRDMQENDRIFVAKSGYTQVSGYVSRERQARQDYWRIAGRFGMTPSDRSGVTPVEAPEEGGADDPLRLTA